MGKYLWLEVVICFWIAVLKCRRSVKVCICVCVCVPGRFLFKVHKLFANCCNNPDSPTQVKFCSAESVVGRQLNWWFFIRGDLEAEMIKQRCKARADFFICISHSVLSLPCLLLAALANESLQLFGQNGLRFTLLSDLRVLCTVWVDGTFACRWHCFSGSREHTVKITLCTHVFPNLLWKIVVRLQP